MLRLADAEMSVPRDDEVLVKVQAADAIAGGCVACARTASLDTYKRARAMLGKALLPPKMHPDAVDARVVVTAALHGRTDPHQRPIRHPRLQATLEFRSGRMNSS
jgi:hypothetical protein